MSFLQSNENFSQYIQSTHLLLKDPQLPMPLRSKTIQELMTYLSTVMILNPISYFIENGFLSDLYKLKGYEKDYEILEILCILITSANKPALKSLLDINTLEFLCSYIPHRKTIVLSKVASLFGKLAGVSNKVRDYIIDSGNFNLIISLLFKENDSKIILSVSYLIYKCSFNISKSEHLENFQGIFQYIRLLMLTQNGIILINVYETINNVFFQKSLDFITGVKGFQKEFLDSFEGFQGNNTEYMKSFINLLIEFIRNYDEKFIKLAIDSCVIEKIAVIMMEQGNGLQKYAISLFFEIYEKDYSEEVLGYLVKIQGMLKFIETALEEDRKERFNLSILIIQSSITINPLKFGIFLNKNSCCLKNLADCYENLVFQEKRIKVLWIFAIFLKELTSCNKEEIFKNENIRLLIKELGNIFGRSGVEKMEDDDEYELTLEIKKMIDVFINRSLEKGILSLKI